MQAAETPSPLEDQEYPRHRSKIIPSQNAETPALATPGLRYF
jgi:hypothetical protein